MMLVAAVDNAILPTPDSGKCNQMTNSFQSWTRTPIGASICALFFSGCFASCSSSNELVSRATSPDGKWNISDEFEFENESHRIILRDSSGKEIMRDHEIFRVDLPMDYAPKLEITNETAGTKGYPMWRLNSSGKWQEISDEERAAKSEESSTLKN